VQEALYEFPKSTQEIASYLVVIVHLAGCAHISWRDIYQGVPNTYVSSLASNAENLFKAYTRANAHTKKIIDLNNFASIRESSIDLCNKFLEYIEHKLKEL
jgi:hypothetical protein